ncbi:ribonucleotide reductase subunit 2 [Spheniscid alphaherpesvirus 1]|uniref:ribonucleoside-diphosphate reductase n=1 Tax=Spheniscid alphaherpesvirus 1 TaxID=2560777 RepID=A0A1R3TEK3_9ALPH|nr:ribonucleotide reductase subunit 2 [Spheniscid alphaherpesvirus 1]SCO83521.1 ribonucleotide reductase subunit 2 [Spheniscid alphaherpesvirus 1]
MTEREVCEDTVMDSKTETRLTNTDIMDVNHLGRTACTHDNDAEKYFYVLQCPDINHLRSLSIMNRWTETELVFADDSGDIDKLTPSELDFYRFLFAFLSAADDLVNCNLGDLSNLFFQKDILHYYIEQECIEVVHSRVYSIIQLMLFRNDSAARLEYVKIAIMDQAIQKKVRWLEAKVRECESVAEKYILMILIEGIFFASSFASIAYLRTHGLFGVTCQSNDLISRDEAIHTHASCCIYNNYLSKHPKPSPCRIYSLFTEAVKIEHDFLRTRAPKCSKIIDLEAIFGYIRFSADRLLSAIGMEPVYNEPKPADDFPLALMIANKHTNFFERRSTAYAGALVNDL